MNQTNAAREVVGSLVDYKSGDRCPVCDGRVTTMFALHMFNCQSCEWAMPIAQEHFVGQEFSYFTSDEIVDDFSGVTEAMSRLGDAAAKALDSAALFSVKAREVVGSLIDYKDGDGCPMCEAPVLTTTNDNFYHCTSCEWTAPYTFTVGFDPALRATYDKKLLDRFLPNLVFSTFGKVALVTDAN